MKTIQFTRLGLLAISIVTCLSFCQQAKKQKGSSGTGITDPLPSWNETDTKKAIMDFVQAVTSKDKPTFVPQEDRIAVFDNDGTLWAEQPMYFQFFFTMDRLRTLAAGHPEWKSKEPYQSILSGDIKKALSTGEKGIVEMMMATHAGMSTDTFNAIVNNWIDASSHPRFKRPFTRCVYQPMLELLSYLRSNGFKTFIVSGGGIEFMRPWTQRVYDIPPEQVIGSSIQTKFEERDGRPVLLRLPAVNFIDDHEGKPVGIQQHIGKRPVAAFGNSDGDFQMLEWTTSGEGPRFGLIVHHDDSIREWAYDRQSEVGRLSRGLDEAPKRNWIVVSMKRDWKKIFPDD